ncbi:MAG: hypothetical protein ACHQIM_17375 [Sphingobacteriales bacterium]
MFRSVRSEIKQKLLFAAIFLAVSVSYCFKYSFNEQDWLIWTNKCLSSSYDPSGDAKLKKWDITITGDSFFRLRKTYAKGKQEYYSFNLHQFNDMDYFGNTSTGTLQLRTTADDIIVQTYNDRRGDVDSMTTVLNIPVKNMDPDRLDSLKEALNYFKGKGL